MWTRTLIVAENAVLRHRISSVLLGRGIRAQLAGSAEALWEKLTHEDFDLVLIERASLPRGANELVTALRELPEHPEVIVLAADENPEERAALLSAGCLAVLWLGLSDGLLGSALVALAERQGDHVLERLGAERSEKRSSLDEFISSSPTMQRFLHTARRVVRGDSALLILGETGVGKERLARSIHSEGRRSNGPFIALNCGALPETLLESELFGHEEGAFTGATRARRGYFELAHRGTIFLDEIGEMPLHLQVKLLRVLEDRSIQRVGSERPVDVDVRILAATNRNLKQEMAEKRFRPDLYYRLAVVTLTVPPLRERREDIPDLAAAFLDRLRRQLGRPARRFHTSAMDALVRHDWPGNVRELINVVERGVLLCPGTEIRVAHLRGDDSVASESRDDTSPPSDPTGSSWEPYLQKPLSQARHELVQVFERHYLETLLKTTRGRVGEAAQRAHLNERSLYGLMKRHGLRKEDFKPDRVNSTGSASTGSTGSSKGTGRQP